MTTILTHAELVRRVDGLVQFLAGYRAWPPEDATAALLALEAAVTALAAQHARTVDAWTAERIWARLHQDPPAVADAETTAVVGGAADRFAVGQRVQVSAAGHRMLRAWQGSQGGVVRQFLPRHPQQIVVARDAFRKLTTYHHVFWDPEVGSGTRADGRNWLR